MVGELILPNQWAQSATEDWAHLSPIPGLMQLSKTFVYEKQIIS